MGVPTVCRGWPPGTDEAGRRKGESDMDKENHAVPGQDWPDTMGQRTVGKGAEAIRRGIEKYGIPVKCGVLAVSSSNNLLGDI